MRLSRRCHTGNQAQRHVLMAQQRLADQDSKRGALSLMVVILFVALAALAGIVVDGSAKLETDQNAVALAQEAARAGATTVDESSAYSSGSFVIDQQQALRA